MQTLKRTQMYFPEELLRRLRKKASAEKTTMASIVRQAVSESLSKEGAKDWGKDPLWDIVGSGRSKEGDLSVNHDVYLYGKKK